MVFAVAVCTSDAQDTKKDPTAIDGIKFDLTYVEKTWGIIVKSLALKEADPKLAREIHMLWEFGKDVDDIRGLTDALAKEQLLFYCFDKDNVVLGKTAVWKTEGEITGKKGDAIRVYASLLAGDMGKTKRVEARGVQKQSSQPPKK
jgi:hypothetical protein